MKIVSAILGALLILMTYSYLKLAHEYRWAKYDLYQEEATTFQLMFHGICRFPDSGWPEFCKASNGSRKEYLDWYSKFTKQPIPDFPA